MKMTYTTKRVRKKGFSLLILVVMVSSLVAVASTAFILTEDASDEERAETTKVRYKKLSQSIFGPERSVTVNGTPVQSGFSNDLGRLPTSLDELVPSDKNVNEWSRVGSDLVATGTDDNFSSRVASQIKIFEGWRGPYFESLSAPGTPELDGWGHPFIYNPPAAGSSFNKNLGLFSAGKGGEIDVIGGANADQYSDDFPFAGAKNIPSSSFRSEVRPLPQNLRLNLDLEALGAKGDLCNYYVGMIYPGLDLSEPMGGHLRGCTAESKAPDSDGSGGTDGTLTQKTEPETIAVTLDDPDDTLHPFDPPGTGLGKSLSRQMVTLDDGTWLQGTLQVTGTDLPPFNSLNASRPNVHTNESSGTLALPGNPQITVNGSTASDLFSKIELGGSSTSTYGLTVPDTLPLRRILTQVEPVPFPEANAPERFRGFSYENINSSADTIRDFSQVRSVNSNRSSGSLTVPPGAYDTVSMSGGDLILGVPGSETASVYSFERLNMNQANLRLVGPVEIRLANTLNVQRIFGDPKHVDWMEVHLPTGGVHMNAESIFYGSIVAPSAHIVINDKAVVTGRVIADKITMNSNSRLLNGDSPSNPGGYRNDFPGSLEVPNPKAGEVTPGSSVETGVADGAGVADGTGEVSEGAHHPLELNETTTMHQAFNFNPKAIDNAPASDASEVVSLGDILHSHKEMIKSLLEDGESAPDLTKFTIDLGAGFRNKAFNKPYARRYQLAIFNKEQAVGDQADDSLAGRLVRVFPQVYTTHRGAEAPRSLSELILETTRPTTERVSVETVDIELVVSDLETPAASDGKVDGTLR